MDAFQTCFSSLSEVAVPVELDRRGSLFTAEVTIAYFELLLMAVRHPSEFKFDTLSLSRFITKSVTSYSCLAVCTAGLGIVNSMSVSEYLALGDGAVTAISSRVLEMIIEIDSEFLIQVCTVCASIHVCQCTYRV